MVVEASTDPVFGKLVMLAPGGAIPAAFRQPTYRLAPVSGPDAVGMLGSVPGVLDGVGTKRAVNTAAIVRMIEQVSALVIDFPEISRLSLNPVWVDERWAVAADAAVEIDFDPAPPRWRPDHAVILEQMNRIMRPDAIAVIGASEQEGKIGNLVMRNLLSAGYEGALYPIHPHASSILGRKAYRSVKDVPGRIDVAVFAIPGEYVASVLVEVGEKQIPGAVLIPSGFAETGNIAGQEELVGIARKYAVRLMGPNIYGYCYTPKKVCATFCPPYDLPGNAALCTQSGGIGASIIGFSRTARMGASAIVGLGNKSDLDEDDLLTFFEQDEPTRIIAMHFEDLKDGRGFAEVASRVSRKKPIVVLKAGRTAAGARAAHAHTGAIAGDDKIYEDVLKQSGVIRARSLRELLELTRGIPLLPTPTGENVLIVTAAGGSGVLLSDACVENGLTLMKMPVDLDTAFRKFIPPFGAAGNPVDITGGQAPVTYQNTVRLGLQDPRVHALVLGYWHTVITPPMVFANLIVDVVQEMRRKGCEKPVVASLSGDVEVEAAAEFLYQHGIPAYAYSTEIPVAVLGAKYRWARSAGLLVPADNRFTASL
jgi:acyl-CoA synthetase (NDP forming)